MGKRGPKSYDDPRVVEWLRDAVEENQKTGRLFIDTPASLATELNTVGITRSQLVWQARCSGPVPGPRGGKWSGNALRRVAKAHGFLPREWMTQNELNALGPVEGICDNTTPRETYLVARVTDKGRVQVKEVEEIEITPEELERYRKERQDMLIQLAAMRKLQEADGSYQFYSPPVPDPWGVRDASTPPQKWVAGVGEIGLAGKDTWSDGVSALVAEMTRHTGRDVLALVDQITGQPGVRGPLKTAVLGLLREIGLQRQANLVLRQQIEKLVTG